MALKSTIYKVALTVADIDRGHYADYALTVARHPSETDERLMVRVLIFAMHAHEHLELGKGVSSAEEPDLWRKDLTGVIEEWIELGQPDEKAVMRACGRAKAVFVYAYGGGAMPWWKGVAEGLERAKNLSVRKLELGESGALAALADRTFSLQATIQDGQVLLSNDRGSLAVDVVTLR
ncbi:MAG TPA: YaeQ family protein [Myxococcota bacterium]|nr:YaeQ family protein [Myxococcota bacterium]